MEKRFGYIAVDKGFINEEQLAEAMMLQIREDLGGQPHRLIGQILLALGHIQKHQISQVLGAMRLPLAFCGSHMKSIAASDD